MIINPYLYASNILWTPSYTTTVVWYDAADTGTISEIGGLVSQLDDKSGNDWHLSQLEGTAQPTTGTRTINDLNVLDFDGFTDYLDSSGISHTLSSNSVAMFAVFEFDSVVNGNANVLAFLGATGDGRDFLGLSCGNVSATNFNVRLGYPTFKTASFSGNPQTNPLLVSGTINSARDVLGYANGTLEASATADVTMGGGLTQIRIMSKIGNVATIDGRVAEVIAVEDISDPTRQKIEGYLAWKWGLEGDLPIGHPYKDAPPYV